LLKVPEGIMNDQNSTLAAGEVAVLAVVALLALAV